MTNSTSCKARKNAICILANIDALYKEGEISLFEYQSYQKLFKEGLELNDISIFRTEIENRMMFLKNTFHFQTIINLLQEDKKYEKFIIGQNVYDRGRNETFT